MTGVRDSVMDFLGLPPTSRRRSRASSPNPYAHPRNPSASSRPSSQYEDVVMQDPTQMPVPITQMPSPQLHKFPRPRSPSTAPLPDNELRAQESLSKQCALSLAAVVTEIAPIPCIGPLIGCLTIVFQAVERVRVNKEQWKLLQGRCVMVTRIAGAQVTNYGGERYPGLQDATHMLQNTITTIADRANHWNSMQELVALFQFQDISAEIRGYFSQLDVCMRMFSYATDVAQMQWIGEFSAVQRKELRELEEMRKLMISIHGNLEVMGKTQDEVLVMTTQISEKLQKVLDDKSEILQNQGTTTMASYADAEQIVKTILTVTNLKLPPQILVGRQCILEANVPIKTGMTCDIYSASFLGGEKVAKKVFRIGMAEKEYVQRYAERFLRDAQLWASFRSEYTLQFYGVGMEAFEGDNHFQLYMVSPLMHNFDAVTYLKAYRNNAGMKKNIMRIITDAARGLQYLHTRNPPVVHSGMRGDNILITDSGGAVLGGFGLTKALQSSTGSDKIPPAVMTGKSESQRWMAPELFAEDSPVLQTSSDIWGWAMATLELVSGFPPYHRHKQPHTVMLDIGRGKTPQRSHHTEFEKYAHKPDELWALMEKCWAIEPEDRPNIHEVIAELERIAGMPE